MSNLQKLILKLLQVGSSICTRIKAYTHHALEDNIVIRVIGRIHYMYKSARVGTYNVSPWAFELHPPASGEGVGGGGGDHPTDVPGNRELL